MNALRDHPAPFRPAALEVMPLARLCDRLALRQRILLEREMARLEDLICRVNAAEPGGPGQSRRLGIAFKAFRSRLVAHMHEEAHLVFPPIRRAGGAVGRSAPAIRALRRRAARWRRQHFQVDEAIARLRHLAAAPASPGAAVAPRRALRQALARFERLIHEQMYEENRFLFPRALSGCRV